MSTPKTTVGAAAEGYPQVASSPWRRQTRLAAPPVGPSPAAGAIQNHWKQSLYRIAARLETMFPDPWNGSPAPRIVAEKWHRVLFARHRPDAACLNAPVSLAAARRDGRYREALVLFSALPASLRPAEVQKITLEKRCRCTARGRPCHKSSAILQFDTDNNDLYFHDEYIQVI